MTRTTITFRRSRWVALLVTTLLLCLASYIEAKTVEPRTGITFEDKVHRKTLKKLGVRNKGPIKVYAVGQYSKEVFVLKMSFNVKAEQMSNALVDALKPRCKTLGCSDQVTEFKSLVMSALPNGAKKGTVLVFNTSGNKVSLTVNGKRAGKISGKAIAHAFAGIYTDSNAVCKMHAVGDGTGGNFRQDPDLIRTVGVMAATTFLLVLYLTTPDKKVKISELHIYPIKSCAEQSVDTATATETGFVGDRVAMVVDKDGKCCTPRDSSSHLFHVTPTIDIDSDTITLTSRSGTTYGVSDPLVIDLSKTKSPGIKVKHNEASKPLTVDDYGNVAASWLETVTGIKECRLVGIGDDYKRQVFVNRAQGDPVPVDNAPLSLADEAPFLLCNEASLEDLNRRMAERDKAPVDMRRFRPNIIVRNLAPWEEDTWSKIRIGTVEFFVWQRCGRCIMTTIDRDTLERNSEPLATLNTFRERDNGMRNFGMHLIPDPATLSDDTEISVGDTVEVLQYDHERLREWLNKFGPASA